MISLIINFIITILFLFGIIYFILFLAKENWKEKGKQKEVKLINKIQKKMKSIFNNGFEFVKIIIFMSLATALAIGMKPIIYKLNYPLGEGYSIFASYIVAICLYIILRPKEHKKLK